MITRYFTTGLIFGVIVSFLIIFILSFPASCGSSHGLEGIKNDACRTLVQTNNCGVGTDTITVNYDIGGDSNTTNDNLLAFCSTYYSRTTDAACKALCGCPGY